MRKSALINRLQLNCARENAITRKIIADSDVVQEITETARKALHLLDQLEESASAQHEMEQETLQLRESTRLLRASLPDASQDETVLALVLDKAKTVKRQKEMLESREAYLQELQLLPLSHSALIKANEAMRDQLEELELERRRLFRSLQ